MNLTCCQNEERRSLPITDPKNRGKWIYGLSPPNHRNPTNLYKAFRGAEAKNEVRSVSVYVYACVCGFLRGSSVFLSEQDVDVCQSGGWDM